MQHWFATFVWNVTIGRSFWCDVCHAVSVKGADKQQGLCGKQSGNGHIVINNAAMDLNFFLDNSLQGAIVGCKSGRILSISSDSGSLLHTLKEPVRAIVFTCASPEKGEWVSACGLYCNVRWILLIKISVCVWKGVIRLKIIHDLLLNSCFAWC